MQAPAQAGQLMQLPRDLHIKIMLHIADGEEPSSRLVSPVERAKSINEMRRLGRTCKELYALFMNSNNFNKRLAMLYENSIVAVPDGALTVLPIDDAAKPGLAIEVGTPAAKVIFDNLFGQPLDHTKRSACLKDTFLKLETQLLDMRSFGLSEAEYKMRARYIKSQMSTLVKWGFDINMERPGFPPVNALFMAINRLDVEYVLLLIDIGAKTANKDKAGNTVVSKAVYVFLYEKHVSKAVNVFSYEKHKCSYNDFITMLRRLIDAGVDINMVDYYRRTPVYHAFVCLRPDLAKFLIENGARFIDMPKQRYEESEIDRARPVIILETVFEFVCRKCSANPDSVAWAELKDLMQSKISNNA